MNQFVLIILKAGKHFILNNQLKIQFNCNSLEKSITLTWAKPKNDGGNPVIGYLVEKREKGSDKWLP